MQPWLIALIVIAVVVLVILAASVKIVRQSEARIVERIGKYLKTLDTGLHFVVPFIDRLSPAISLKERVADFKPQSVITKDNVTMHIDTVVYFQITDPKLFTYGVERPISAIENLTATTLRNIVGDLELDQTLTSRDTVNGKMRDILDEATDPWGIKVNRVELKNIILPRDIQDSMEKQMRAERERREAILKAEGEKRSKILIAEGEKESALLRAEAKKVALITEAEGQAEAIKRIIDAHPDAAYITLQGYEALKAMANGSNTTLIVPSELQNVAGLFASVSETLKLDQTKARKPEVKVADKKASDKNKK